MVANWRGVASVYAETFGCLCAGTTDELLRAIDVVAEPGSRLLDVGTGTGTIAAAASARGYEVDATDQDAGMIEFARAAHSGIRFGEETLPHLGFPGDSFDAATANFVVNHTADPRASVAEIGRVLRHGSPFAMTIWPGGVSELQDLWDRVMQAAPARRPEQTRLSREKDFPRTAAGLHALLEGNGFESVSVAHTSWTFSIAPTKLWRAVDAGIASIGSSYLAQDEEGRRRMKSAFDELTGDLAPDGMLRLAATALLGVGHRQH